MPSERLPYAICRLNKRGDERWYWQRKGHPIVRLSNDPVERLAEVLRLNGDASKADAVPRGTMAWCVAAYRRSVDYAKLRPASRKIYDRWLDHFGSKLGKFSIAALRRPEVMEIRDRLVSRYGQATVLHAFAVLRVLFALAIDYGLIAVNPASKPKLASPAPREALWSDANLAAAVKHAAPEAALGLSLLLYTAQRPSDVVRMAWSQYDGDRITLRQVKTGALVAVPVHRDLKAILDAERRRGPLICVKQSGRAWRSRYLSEAIRDALALAGVTGLQVRDLRRTAVVKLAEAGADIPQIAAVTGHSLANAERILQAYLPRTYAVAAVAMRKWEQKTP